VKILLDHNLDWRLSRALPDHEVKSTLQMGWDTLMNGVLLSEAESEGFQIMITADKSIKTQQSITGRSIALIVLRAPNNQRKTHLTMMSEVLEIIPIVLPGEVVEVFHEIFRNKIN
jgi:predicted nuclease of predicted toxin-antitoxin system